MTSGLMLAVLGSLQRCADRAWLQLQQIGVERIRSHRLAELQSAPPLVLETFDVDTWQGRPELGGQLEIIGSIGANGAKVDIELARALWRRSRRGGLLRGRRHDGLEK